MFLYPHSTEVHNGQTMLLNATSGGGSLAGFPLNTLSITSLFGYAKSPIMWYRPKTISVDVKKGLVHFCATYSHLHDDHHLQGCSAKSSHLEPPKSDTSCNGCNCAHPLVQCWFGNLIFFTSITAQNLIVSGTPQAANLLAKLCNSSSVG